MSVHMRLSPVRSVASVARIPFPTSFSSKLTPVPHMPKFGQQRTLTAKLSSPFGDSTRLLSSPVFDPASCQTQPAGSVRRR